MKPFEHKRLERVRYWEGQLLRSADFREIAAVEAQCRWWHARAVHNAVGVRKGFEPGLEGIPRRVVVSPGIAFDCFGRELLLDKPQVVPFPANLHRTKAADLYLLIRYREPRCGSRSARISHACFEPESALATGNVEFFWRLASINYCADGVAIGRLVNYSPKLQADAATEAHTQPESAIVSEVPHFDSGFVRATPIPVARPLLVSGDTVPGNTAWVPWNFTGLINETLQSGVIGARCVVDTSAAGFTETPYYFASLQGPIWNANSQSLLAALCTSITDETLTSFTFNILLQTPAREPAFGMFESESHNSIQLISDPAAFLLFAQQQKLFISWSACQMPSSASPAVDESLALEEMLSSVLQSQEPVIG